MSEFDDLFRDKLEEESQFPNANKNWKLMTKRLDAFQVGATAWQQAAVWWKAAAISTALISAALGWKMHNIMDENRALEAQIAQMSQMIVPGPLEHTPPKPSQSNKSDAPANGSTSELHHQGTTTVSHPLTKANEPIKDRPQESDHGNKPVKPKPKTIKEAAAQNMGYPQASLPNTGTDHLLAYQHIVDSLQQQIASLLVTLAEKEAIVASQPNPTTTVTEQDTEMAIKAQIDRFLEEASVVKAEEPATAPPPLVTEPFKPKKDRFMIGIQASKIAFSPAQKSILEGKTYGLNADYRIWNNMWLSGSVEHATVNINAVNVPTGFQLPDLPKPVQNPNPGPGPKPNHKLIKVAADLDFTQIGLGIRYRLPLSFPVRPVFSIAHQWVSSAKNMVSFEYDDPGPKHEEEFFIGHTDRIIQDNNWRYGLALEYPIKAATLRVSADYQQFNKNTPLMPNTWSLGAAVAIRLF